MSFSEMLQKIENGVMEVGMGVGVEGGEEEVARCD